MTERISSRIADFLAALPLEPGMTVLEIGCGPGVAARAIVRSYPDISVLAIDRSAKAIAQARAGSQAEMATGRLAFREVTVEDFELGKGEKRFDLAFAMRVGALDGRHPELEAQAMARLKAALKPDGLLITDDRAPVKGRDITTKD